MARPIAYIQADSLIHFGCLWIQEVNMQYFAYGIDKKTKNHVNIARFTPVLHIDTQHKDGPSIPENERIIEPNKKLLSDFS